MMALMSADHLSARGWERANWANNTTSTSMQWRIPVSDLILGARLESLGVAYDCIEREYQRQFKSTALWRCVACQYVLEAKVAPMLGFR
jgi:hypothetical protein